MGRGIARSFADHGAEAVVVADVREDPKEDGEPTHELIESETDTTGVFSHCDVTNRDDLVAAVDACEGFGGIDVLVNNAGIWHAEDFFDVTESEFREMLDVNLTGAYVGSQVAGERLVENGGGAIVNVSSVAGLFGNGDWPTYSASKGGLTTLTYSLAHKLGPHGVRVNAVHPGGIQTMIGGRPDDSEAALEQATDAWNLQPGQHVEYVVVNDEAQGRARVALPEDAERYDTAFYTDLAARAARSILAPVGYDTTVVREVLTETTQVSLGSYR